MCKLKTQNSKLKTSTQNFKLYVLSFSFAFCLLPFALACFAQETPSSGELIANAWKAHADKDIEGTFKYTQECIELYKEQAAGQQATLKDFPRDKQGIERVQILNDVAVAYFIQAESYREQGKTEEAIKSFKTITSFYCYAQAWDQRGWYWKVAEIAREGIFQLNPGESIPASPCLKQVKITTQPSPVSKINLYDPGTEDFVSYAKYGNFENVGTKEYRYVIKDQEGLSAAVGEGIYPNTNSIKWDPEFKKAQKEKRLQGSHWDFVYSTDLETAFLKWVTASEPPGVKLFYTGLILEKAGLVKQAIKCYYSIIVHFPGSYGWTYWKTPWYIGEAAIAKINFLLRRNPQLGFRLAGADIKIINGFDKDVSNDVVVTNPGRFEKVSLLERLKPKPPIDLLSIRKRVGKGKVHLLQYESGDWQLMVDNKPYIIKGTTYSPTKVGQSPDNNTLGNWMEEDFNKNNQIDGPYDAFVDKNRNNRQDRNEPGVGDFRLMQEMGVNTIRLFHHPNKVNKELLRGLYKNYGIRVIMGDFLGKYTFGSGASWSPGTDYANEAQKKNMMQSVTNMVLEFKDEPYILFWLLGNENVYGYACSADRDPESFFKFANEVARQIKVIDPEHPVAICNGDTLFLDKFGKYCSDIDIFGTNAYRGDYGFGLLWERVKDQADKPVFISEFGCPAFAENKTPEEGEYLQAEYHRAAWEDAQHNMANSSGVGNCIGGVFFEWMDEWWKAYEPSKHDTKGVFTGPFPDGHMHEEWLGVCGQGNGDLSPFLRQLRQAYFMYKKMWR